MTVFDDNMQEAKIQRLEAALNAANLEGLSWKARAEQNYTEWEEANKLLEQTIEVLRAFYMEPPWYPDSGACRFCGVQASPGVEHYDFCAYRAAKPLLDNLKALKKEGTE